MNDTPSIILRCTRMFFGLRDAPRVAEKFLRLVDEHLRRSGIRMVRIMDDLAILASTFISTVNQTLAMLKLTIQLGIMWGWKKCTWKPTATVKFYGCLWTSHTGGIYIPRKKLLLMQAKILEIVNLDTCNAKLAGSVQGIIRAYSNAM